MRAAALVATFGLSLLVLPRTAHADEVDACANAYEAAQRLHQKNDPKALSEASTCARDVCPDVLKKECAAWAKEWAPSEKPATKPEAAAPSPSPSPAPTSPSSLSSSDDAPSLETARPIPVLAYALGGGGIVALGVAAGFAIHGMNVRSDLQKMACEPNCPKDEVDSARRSFLVADVFGIAGLAALGGALAVYLTRPGTAPSSSASARARIQLSPLLGGAAVRGTF